MYNLGFNSLGQIDYSNIENPAGHARANMLSYIRDYTPERFEKGLTWYLEVLDLEKQYDPLEFANLRQAMWDYVQVYESKFGAIPNFDELNLDVFTLGKLKQRMDEGETIAVAITTGRLAALRQQRAEEEAARLAAEAAAVAAAAEAAATSEEQYIPAETPAVTQYIDETALERVTPVIEPTVTSMLKSTVNIFGREVPTWLLLGGGLGALLLISSSAAPQRS